MVHVFVDDMSEIDFICNGLLKLFVFFFCCHSVTSLFSMVFNWTNNVFIADQQDYFLCGEHLWLTLERSFITTCGLEFRQGRGFHKHVQTCVVPHDDSYHHGMPTSDDDGSVHADGDALPPAPDPSGCNQDDSDDDFADNSIETHLQKLDDAGTLCNEHVLQYAGWGKVYTRPKKTFSGSCGAWSLVVGRRMGQRNRRSSMRGPLGNVVVSFLQPWRRAGKLSPR